MATKPTYEELEKRVRELEQIISDSAFTKTEPVIPKIPARPFSNNEGPSPGLTLEEIFDTGAIQSLMDDFHKLTDFGVAILDLDGKVLVATGWQDICTEFHRIHPETSRNCLESDLTLSNGIEPGAFRLYPCKNNMWDMATPIMVGNRKVGNLYLGQFLFEEESPDVETFQLQAQRYGFDEDKYIAALKRVPRWSREKVDTVMNFYTKLSNLISELSYKNFLLNQTMTEKKEREAFLKTLIDAIPFPVFYKGRDEKYLGFNRAFEEFFGETKEHLIGKSVFDINPPELAKIYKAQDQELFNSGGVQRYESQCKNASGELSDVLFNKAVFTDNKGTAAGLIGVLLDITEQKRAQEALRENEEKFRLAFDAGPDSVNVNRLKDGLYVEINEGFTRLTGFTREDVAGKTSLEINIWHNVADRMKLVQELREHGFCNNLEAQFRRKDGSVTTALMSARVISLQNEPHILSITRDISERKQAEAERERLLLAIEQTNEVVVITDESGTIQYVNPAFEKITGYSNSEAIGENPRLLKSGRQNGDFYKDLWDTILSGKPWAGRLLNKRKDGALYTGECSISPVKDQNGNVTNFVWISRDISKELDLEKKISQAQKMEAIGNLAGGIAHDFNNILSPIMLHAEMAMMDLPSNSPLQMNMKQIYKSGERARDLTQQILTFARIKEKEKIPLRVSIMVKEAIKFLRATIPSTIDIRYEFKARLDTILADPTQIHQIVMNLCTNAAYAMNESGGELKVTLTEEHVGPEEASRFEEIGPGEFLKISVRDTGAGISPDVIPKIFEPYFTTKEQGRGTGLGLAVVHGIVKGCDGHVTVESELGKGSVCVFRSIPDTHSNSFRTVIPIHSGHPFQSKADTHSD